MANEVAYVSIGILSTAFAAFWVCLFCNIWKEYKLYKNKNKAPATTSNVNSCHSESPHTPSSSFSLKEFPSRELSDYSGILVSKNYPGYTPPKPNKEGMMRCSIPANDECRFGAAAHQMSPAMSETPQGSAATLPFGLASQTVSRLVCEPEGEDDSPGGDDQVSYYTETNKSAIPMDPDTRSQLGMVESRRVTRSDCPDRLDDIMEELSRTPAVDLPHPSKLKSRKAGCRPPAPDKHPGTNIELHLSQLRRKHASLSKEQPMYDKEWLGMIGQSTNRLRMDQSETSMASKDLRPTVRLAAPQSTWHTPADAARNDFGMSRQLYVDGTDIGFVNMPERARNTPFLAHSGMSVGREFGDGAQIPRRPREEDSISFQQQQQQSRSSLLPHHSDSKVSSDQRWPNDGSRVLLSGELLSSQALMASATRRQDRRIPLNSLIADMPLHQTQIQPHDVKRSTPVSGLLRPDRWGGILKNDMSFKHNDLGPEFIPSAEQHGVSPKEHMMERIPWLGDSYWEPSVVMPTDDMSIGMGKQLGSQKATQNQWKEQPVSGASSRSRREGRYGNPTNITERARNGPEVGHWPSQRTISDPYLSHSGLYDTSQMDDSDGPDMYLYGTEYEKTDRDLYIPKNADFTPGHDQHPNMHAEVNDCDPGYVHQYEAGNISLSSTVRSLLADDFNSSYDGSESAKSVNIFIRNEESPGSLRREAFDKPETANRLLASTPKLPFRSDHSSLNLASEKYTRSLLSRNIRTVQENSHTRSPWESQLSLKSPATATEAPEHRVPASRIPSLRSMMTFHKEVSDKLLRLPITGSQVYDSPSPVQGRLPEYAQPPHSAYASKSSGQYGNNMNYSADTSHQNKKASGSQHSHKRRYNQDWSHQSKNPLLQASPSIRQGDSLPQKLFQSLGDVSEKHLMANNGKQIYAEANKTARWDFEPQSPPGCASPGLESQTKAQLNNELSDIAPSRQGSETNEGMNYEKSDKGKPVSTAELSIAKSDRKSPELFSQGTVPEE